MSNYPPITSSTAVGHSTVRLEMGLTVIRADGTVEELGVVSSSKWGKWSWPWWKAFFRIQRVNWRHKRRMRREA